MTNSETEVAVHYLNGLHRADLVALLSRADLRLGGSMPDLFVIVEAPQPFADAFKGLSPEDKKRIAEGAASNRSGLRVPGDIAVRVTGAPVEGHETLLPDLLIHRQMMIDVATGGRPIQEVDDFYSARQARIAEACAAAGIRYENSFASLWDWYHYWKDNFGRYTERRQYIRKLFTGPVASAAGRINKPSPVAVREPTGWERVDRGLGKARTQFAAAGVEEDWQAVGLLCREVLISLAQAVYDPAIHRTEDGVTPSSTDAKRMIEAYVGREFSGASFQEVRAHARASVDLTLNLQHRRTATRQLADLCLEATSSTVAVISIIAGRTG